MIQIDVCDMCGKKTSDLTPAIIYPHPTMTGTRVDICDECLETLKKISCFTEGFENG